MTLHVHATTLNAPPQKIGGRILPTVRLTPGGLPARACPPAPRSWTPLAPAPPSSLARCLPSSSLLAAGSRQRGARGGALGPLGALPGGLGRSGSLQVVVRGEDGVPETVALEEARRRGSEGPTFFQPLPIAPTGGPFPEDKPFLMFLPGIDATGASSALQWGPLTEAFDLRCLSVPTGDRSTFSNLVEIVSAYVAAELRGASPDRPVYICGESVGGILALAVALKDPVGIHRVVLVNPATSFPRSTWQTLGFAGALSNLPDAAYEAVVGVALSPLLADPVQLAATGVDSRKGLVEQTLQLSRSLLGMVPAATSELREVIPRATLGHRLQLSSEGAAAVEPRLSKVVQRVLVVAGTGDLLLPSEEEAQRLVRRIPRCSAVELRGRSHAMLMENGVDLAKVIKGAGFYVSRRQMSSGSGAGAGAAGGGKLWGPMEVPTEEEVERVAGKDSFLGTLRRVTSPVFLSTCEETGRVERGFGEIPDERPLIFVGNHQTYAPDVALVISELLSQRRVLVRGLAHPVVFSAAGAQERRAQGTSWALARDEASSILDRVDGAADSPPSDGFRDGGSGIFSSFGAVPLSSRNMYRLLEAGEACLLYPGGVREAYKRKGEQYRLVWPDTPGLVRMAARHGATIVPLSAVGAEDGVQIVLDANDLMRTPVVGSMLRGGAAAAAAAAAAAGEGAREGGDTPGSIVPSSSSSPPSSSAADAMMIPPLSVPRLPDRYYFLFGAPVRTDPAMVDDPEACAAAYQDVKEGVEGGIEYLRGKREFDPYRGFMRRVVFESTSLGRQAPSFTP